MFLVYTSICFGETLYVPMPGDVTMELVKIPQGSFMMGSPDNEKNRTNDEGPQHYVYIDSFYMGKYEVTNKQYRAFRPDHDSKDYKEYSLNGDNQPVANVDWNWAKEFCRWLSKETERNFRLPSEAEWEYACRAGTATSMYWGDDIDTACKHANVSNPGIKKEFNWQWEAFNCEDGYKVTSPVGSFTPNKFGLYDMLGNVSEYCMDNYHNNYNDAPKDGTAWVVPYNKDHVLRGGSWYDGPIDCRSAARSYPVPGYRLNSTWGFRVVMNEE
jgi:formylglycine-generating enzyme required for sulfatase activity